jgi:hypothetical protein
MIVDVYVLVIKEQRKLQNLNKKQSLEKNANNDTTRKKQKIIMKKNNHDDARTTIMQK